MAPYGCIYQCWALHFVFVGIDIGTKKYISKTKQLGFKIFGAFNDCMGSIVGAT